LRNTTVALTQVYSSRCIALRHAPLEALKTTWRDTSPLWWEKHHSYGSTISQQSASLPGQLCLDSSQPTTRWPIIVLAPLTTSLECGWDVTKLSVSTPLLRKPQHSRKG
jgi:hypothetical protein